jgi:uncharacterized membrane protein YwaF
VLKHFDTASVVTILITIALFAIALVEKGLTQEILLEAAVFLVSVKLIHATYKTSIYQKRLEEKLDQILSRLPK